MTNKKIPGAVLFVCTLNSIRSPMAEGLLKSIVGTKAYVQSCGLEAGDLNELMVAVMGEKKIDMSGHCSKSLENLKDDSFDVVIAFTAQAHGAVQGVFGEGDTDTEILLWETPDPSAGAMNVRAMMDHYRAVRDNLEQRLRKKFATG